MNKIEELDKLYKEWSGVSHLENSNKQVHDSAEAQDFARYCIDKIVNSAVEEQKEKDAEIAENYNKWEKGFYSTIADIAKLIREQK